jgi:Protein of unknown function (DUF2490)
MNKYALSLLLVFGLLKSYAQEGTSLWTGLSIEKKVTTRVSVGFAAQIRMPENVSYTQSYLGELGVSYKLAKSWEVSGTYRYFNKRKDENKAWKSRHRFYTDLNYSHKFKHFKFENRLRYQHQFKDNDGEIGFDTSYLRNKVGLSYFNKSPLTPYLSGDLFYQIGYVMDQIRPEAGLGYKINKKNTVQLGLCQNIDLVNGLNSGAILRLNYKVKL